MTKPPNSHYSPVFANRPWADDGHVLAYIRQPNSGAVEIERQGLRQWGKERGLYSWDTERALDRELETHAALVQQALLRYENPTIEDRRLWSQFLLSQHVRTPTFMRYENAMQRLHGKEETAEHDRVGCPHCADLAFVGLRDWCILQAHEDDYFLRSDNPVLLTGFVERAATCLIYPLSPRLCFVACSMSEGWSPWSTPHRPRMFGIRLAKGGTFLFNFHLVSAAEASIIAPPRHRDDRILEKLCADELAQYPQAPFGIHPDPERFDPAFESVRMIMSVVDARPYPNWPGRELEPFPELEGRDVLHAEAPVP